MLKTAQYFSENESSPESVATHAAHWSSQFCSKFFSFYFAFLFSLTVFKYLARHILMYRARTCRSCFPAIARPSSSPPKFFRWDTFSKRISGQSVVRLCSRNSEALTVRRWNESAEARLRNYGKPVWKLSIKILWDNGALVLSRREDARSSHFSPAMGESIWKQSISVRAPRSARAVSPPPRRFIPVVVSRCCPMKRRRNRRASFYRVNTWHMPRNRWQRGIEFVLFPFPRRDVNGSLRYGK